ncbi:hypothetical protein C8R44DRAFT_735291 [Mycena epipterygia]|nr:hypothetical protein C8R44DRAFT_735291 [Mycena epipterygia]
MGYPLTIERSAANSAAQRVVTARRATRRLTTRDLPHAPSSALIATCLPVSDPKDCAPLHAPPILLTRICRDWRAIAVSTPQLWNHVHLEFGGKLGLRAGYMDSWWVSFLETWLSRAQTQPLSMIISNLHTEPDEALVGLLDSHRQQWRDVTLKLPFNRFYQFSTNDALPNLERLTLDAYSIPRVVYTPITAFQHAPILNHIHLGGWLRPTHFILPWLQLTSLELTTATAQDCLDCLRRAPKLVTCVLEIQDSGASVVLALVPALLRMHSLTLTGPGPSAIFPCVVMPALEELDLVGRSLNAGDLTRAHFFVSRSGCQLRRLRLHFISHFLTKPTIQLLEALPALEDFQLAVTEAKTITSIFLRLGDGASFLPQLQSLSISHHKMYDSNLPAMFHTITNVLARRESSSPEHVQLSSFALLMQHEETPPRPWVRQRWEELVARGMRLSVKNRHECWI